MEGWEQKEHNSVSSDHVCIDQFLEEVLASSSEVDQMQVGAVPIVDKLMPNDMENFMEYHIMGYVSQIRMKRDCVPTKFHCQRNRHRSSDKDRSLKRQRKCLKHKCKKHKDKYQGSILQRGHESNKVHIGSSDIQQQTGGFNINPGVPVNTGTDYSNQSPQTELNSPTNQTSPIEIPNVYFYLVIPVQI